MIKRLPSILLVFFFYFELNAQDPKFSQYFASPLTINPALTGYFDGYYRLALNTRNQWANVGDPYNTTSISGEYKFNDEYYYDDIFTVGLNGLFEESFNKILRSNVINAGFSYYRFFDGDHKIKFGLAPQVSYISKKLDYNALTFASQYNNGNFDFSLPNYLDQNSSGVSYFDLNLGANLAFTLEHFNISVGYALYHITNPNESLENHYLGKVPARQTLTFGLRYFTNDLIDINFTGYHMRQRKSNDEVLGTVIGFKPTYDSKFKIDFGLWHKFNEKSFFPYLGFEMSNYSVGINYTATSNRINDIQPRTFELSLIVNDRNFTKFKNTCKF